LEFVDKFNRNIRLTNERWKHIADTHPELKNLLNELSGALRLSEKPVFRIFQLYCLNLTRRSIVIWFSQYFRKFRFRHFLGTFPTISH